MGDGWKALSLFISFSQVSGHHEGVNFISIRQILLKLRQENPYSDDYFGVFQMIPTNI